MNRPSINLTGGHTLTPAHEFQISKSPNLWSLSMTMKTFQNNLLYKIFSCLNFFYDFSKNIISADTVKYKLF